jgi:hypothetical protein
MGGDIWSLVATNTGNEACTLTGAPGLAAAATSSGTTIPGVSTGASNAAQWGLVDLSRMILEPGGSAASFVQESLPVAGCASSSPALWQLQITPPGDTTTAVADIPAEVPTPCQSSSLLVSPFHPTSLRPFASDAPGPPATPSEQCPQPAFQLSDLGSMTDAGVTALRLSMTNTSSQTCALALPWPSVDPLAADGSAPLPVAEAYTGQSIPASLAALGVHFAQRMVTSIQAGQTLYFDVLAPPGPSSQGCASASALSIGVHTAGGDQVSTVTLPAPVPLCAGAYTTPAVTSTNPLAPSPPAAQPLNDTSGFYYGTDASVPRLPIGSGPYGEPFSNGASDGTMGGYVGELGDWNLARPGCAIPSYAMNDTVANDANANVSVYNAGIGTSFFFMLGGPGADPSWNGSQGQAEAWGARQANAAAAHFYGSSEYNGYSFTPILWIDVELQNGWTNVMSCDGGTGANGSFSGQQRRWVFNGFFNCLEGQPTSDTGGVACTGGATAGSLGWTPGVYSAPGFWNLYFSPSGLAPSTWQWTFQNSNPNWSSTYAPQSWSINQPDLCQYKYASNNAAYFFGGNNLASAGTAMWQWAGGGGCNTTDDLDQIDVAKLK